MEVYQRREDYQKVKIKPELAMKVKKSQWKIQRRRQKIKNFFLALGIILLIFLSYWLIFLSDFFQIKQINILDDSSFLLEDINQYFKQRNAKFVPAFIYKIFPEYQKNYRNMLLFSENGLALFLKHKYPEINEIALNLSSTNQTLQIKTTLRESEYIFCQQEGAECYFVDKNGVIFERAPSISGSLIKKIISQKAVKFQFGQVLFTKELWQKIEKFFLLTATEQSPFQIESIYIDPDNLSSLKIKTRQGWFLFFNLNDNFEYLLKVIQELKESRGSKGFSQIEYLDCRFLPKIYIK